MVFRFSNNIIEPLWNRNYVDHVQITAAETVGVEHPAALRWERPAALPHGSQHLFQLLTMTAEPPISFDADQVRNKQAEVLHAIQPLSPEDVLKNMVPAVRWRHRGRSARCRLSQRTGCRSHSNTETFVALNYKSTIGAGLAFLSISVPANASPAHHRNRYQFRAPPFVLFRTRR